MQVCCANSVGLRPCPELYGYSTGFQPAIGDTPHRKHFWRENQNAQWQCGTAALTQTDSLSILRAQFYPFAAFSAGYHLNKPSPSSTHTFPEYQFLRMVIKSDLVALPLPPKICSVVPSFMAFHRRNCHPQCHAGDFCPVSSTAASRLSTSASLLLCCVPLPPYCFIDFSTEKYQTIRLNVKTEKDAGSRCIMSMVLNSITVCDPRNQNNTKTFTFDLSYWSHSAFIKNKEGILIPDGPTSRFADQRRVFDDLGQEMLNNAWKGYNATLLAYGQTGSGKSYSMVGYGPDRGIIPLTCEELFKAIKQNQEHEKQYQIYFSMLEIYNEKAIDLLSKSKQSGGLKVRESPQRGFYVEDLKSVPCESYEHIEQLMKEANKKRITASTNINTTSSRSHMIITIRFKQVFLKENLTKQSDINLVDLAGSERQKASGSEGDRLREGTAINLSLTTLGNVISALAEIAMGKKVLHVPYRNSTLTKLLQSTLGGNSKTMMIATVSPADICYEETLSTLRYAERTKNIQNKAVINENPTERLVQELKAENAKLRLKITKIRNSGQRVEEITEELRRTLAENELQMAEIQTSWEQRLERAQKEWEQQYLTLTQEKHMIQLFPYLSNVNMDPQLSAFVKFFIQDGETDVGQSGSFPQSIVIKGFGIADKHATITNLDNKVTLEPHGQAKVTLNGVLVLTKVQLRHLDRVILGSNSTYIYVGFPCERNSEDLSKYDYDFFQSELAAVEGFDRDVLGKNRKVDPSVLAVFLDYIRVKPMVAEANQISEELNKDLKFELEVKNLALTDSRGHDLVKEVMVKVTNKMTHQVWVWSRAKFVNRKFIMEDIYQRFVDGEVISVDRESDPFWDPIEAVHLGTAYVWLQSLNYCIALEEHVEFHNSQGEEEAILQMNLMPCTPTGQPLGEDAILIDPTELVDQRLDFQVQITQCLGIKWLKQNNKRGIQIWYHVLNHPYPFRTEPVWNTVNASIDHVLQFTVKSVSQELLNYLQNHALVLDLWGLQEGCTEICSSLGDSELTDEGSIIIDHVRPRLPSSSGVEMADDQLSELYIKLSKLEQENELLRDVNRTLRRDNVTLKGTLKKMMSDAPRPDEKSFHQTNIQTFGCRGTPKAGYEVEFAKALKTFYQSMNRVRNQLLGLRRHRPPDEDDVEILRIYLDKQTRAIKDFGDSLELCMNTLKNDVSLIVKKKKEHILWCSVTK
ncbi:kinesin-like protein KIF28 [Heterodontus francisci]|uniref:kinesin-like protein KIF28 n=1 Tax=Heterodontus francisci TaxID=7792 RepID=UPI00355ADBBE